MLQQQLPLRPLVLLQEMRPLLQRYRHRRLYQKLEATRRQQTCSCAAGVASWALILVGQLQPRCGRLSQPLQAVQSPPPQPPLLHRLPQHLVGSRALPPAFRQQLLLILQLLLPPPLPHPSEGYRRCSIS